MKRHDPYTQEYKLEAILDPDSSTFLIPRCTFLTIKRTLRAWSLTGGIAYGLGSLQLAQTQGTAKTAANLGLNVNMLSCEQETRI